MLYRVTGLCAAAILAAGCAIHPLPENVTPFDTNNIVFHIRCEARDAAKHATTAFLLNPNQNFSEQTVEEGRKLQNGDTKFENLDFNKLDPRARFFLTKYQGTAIAYDFTFDITEDNAAGANVNFLTTLTHGTFGLAAGVSSDRQRETIRNFRVADTFGGLRVLKSCDQPSVIVAGNYIYPITGKVGLDEMVMTFVNLNEHENLTAPAAKSASDATGVKAFAAADAPPPVKKKVQKTATAASDQKVPVLADTFSFQTTISGTVTPTLNITPVSPSHFNLTQASIPLSASRKDLHKLVVALSLSNQACPPFSGLLLSSPVNPGRSTAENCALREIDNQKTINSLNKILTAPN